MAILLLFPNIEIRMEPSPLHEKIAEVRNLSKVFGKITAVKDVSLDVYKGDIFGLLGPNGSGKSTTIRAMLSLISPNSGSVRLFGEDIRENREKVLSRIGCIVEKPDFYPYLSAERNLEIFARLSGREIPRSRIAEMLDFVGLKGREKDKVKQYSHGMKQRLGIAQAILNDPDFIILDEPTTGLDPQGIIDVRNLILKLKTEQGKTILLSSHILTEIELIANRMAIISKGRLIVQGEVSQLLNQEELIVSFEVDQPAEARDLIETCGIPNVFAGMERNKILLQIDYEMIPLITKMLTEHQIRIFGIDARRKLEDFFLKLVSEDVLEKHM